MSLHSIWSSTLLGVRVLVDQACLLNALSSPEHCNAQVLVWVLSYDGVNSPEPLAITAAAAALSISGTKAFLQGAMG